MRIRASVLSLAVAFAFSAFPAETDWVVRGGFGSPAGISVSQDRIVVSGSHEIIELAADGTMRGAKGFEAAGDGRIQIERVAGAREGLIAAGVHISGDRHDPAVIRVGGDGAVLWARAVEGNWLSDMTVVAEAADGDIVMATLLDTAMLLVRFSAQGETKWSRVLDRTDIEGVQALVATCDGGVLAVTTALTRFGALTRIDRNGKVLWDRVLGSADAGFGFYSAVELADGGFLAVGRMRIYSTNNREGWLLRISPSGEVLWQKMVGGDGEDGLFAIAQLGPNEFAAVGGTTSAGKGDADTWIVTVTADGAITGEMAVGDATDDGPLDPFRAFAVASDGHLLFVSPAQMGMMAGRIRSASAACKLTRAIRTRQSASTATHHADAALVQSAVKPIIKPIVISSTKNDATVARVCQWSATDAAGAVPQIIAVKPPDEESIFADGVAALLIERKFLDLDRSAAAIRDGRSTFDSGRSKLLAFYQVLGRHASLTALGDDEHRHLLEGWHSATHSATSGVALASYYSAAAERIRGAGFFNSVLDADAERYRQLQERALELLAAAEQTNSCDAPCYDLWIRTAKLGGWSKPLKKLVALDPAYWEAFPSAATYLGENWGGRPGSIGRFVGSFANPPKGPLGDAPYALHYAQWRFGVIYSDQPAPPPPDWGRMRAGFQDFQRLHPRSRMIAHLFAAAAYRVVRDREAARPLFQSPMLTWSPGDAWADRAEYERAKAWALSEPVETFAARLPAAARGAGPSNLPRLVARAQASLPDGAVERTHAFLVDTPKGPVGITATRNAAAATSWILERNMPLPRESVTTKATVWAAARFTPPPAFAKALHPLKLRSAPLAIGERLFIVACRTTGVDCIPRSRRPGPTVAELPPLSGPRMPSIGSSSSEPQSWMTPVRWPGS